MELQLLEHISDVGKGDYLQMEGFDHQPVLVTVNSVLGKYFTYKGENKTDGRILYEDLCNLVLFRKTPKGDLEVLARQRTFNELSTPKLRRI